MAERRRSWFRDSGENAAPDAPPLARALLRRRGELGLTREEAARRAGISAHYWWELESGRRQGSRATLERIASAVRMKPHQLLASADALAEEDPSPSPRSPAAADEGVAKVRRLADRIEGVLGDAPPAEAEVVLLIALGRARARLVMEDAASGEARAGEVRGAAVEGVADAAPAPPAHSELATAIASIPPGRWASYGDVAAAAGRPGAARSVGAMIAAHPGLEGAHRVLRASGEMASGWRGADGDGPAASADRLREEGIEVNGRRADAGRRLGAEELAGLVTARLKRLGRSMRSRVPSLPRRRRGASAPGRGDRADRTGQD